MKNTMQTPLNPPSRRHLVRAVIAGATLTLAGTGMAFDAAPPEPAAPVAQLALAAAAPEPPEPPGSPLDDPNSTGAAIERGVKSAMREAERALAHAADMGRSVAMRFTASGRPTTLVMPGAKLKPEAADGLGEDLEVMNRILEKALGRPGEARRFFAVPWGPGGAGRDLDALYLDGFGALFLLNLDFPLIAPAQAKAAQNGEPTDRIWEDARREVMDRRTDAEARLWSPVDAEGAAPFDGGRVEDLRRALVESLKHAANLRALGPDEAVAIAVFGTAPRMSGTTAGERRAIQRGGQKVVVIDESIEEVVRAGGDGPGRRAGSVMTLRVRKGDIDAYAKGRLTVEDFEKKVSVDVR